MCHQAPHVMSRNFSMKLIQTPGMVTGRFEASSSLSSPAGALSSSPFSVQLQKFLGGPIGVRGEDMACVKK